MEKIKKLVSSRYNNYYNDPFQLTDGQAEIFDIIASRRYPRTHCITSTQYGKSDVVSMAVLTRVTSFPEKWAIVAPSTKKSRIIMGYLISHVFDNEYTMARFRPEEGESIDKIRRERSKEKMTFALSNGQIGEVFTLSSEGKRTTDLLDALMGFGAPNVIIDESSLIDDVQYVGILRMLGGHKDNFLFEIGNAMRRNHFHRTSLDPKYHHVNIDVYQALKEGRVTQDFIDEMKGKPMFSQLYENKFPAQDAVDTGGYGPLYSDTHLLGRIKPAIDIFGSRRLGCDVGGEGTDESTIIERGRNGARILFKQHTPDTMTLVAKLSELVIKSKKEDGVGYEKVYIDKVGIGKAVYDRVIELPEMYYLGQCIVVGVAGGEKAQDTNNFINKRAEMFWRQREWLETGLLEGSGWNDLLDVRYKVQSDKKVKMKGKEEMLRDSVQSPNVADALSLTFYDNDTSADQLKVIQYQQESFSRTKENQRANSSK